MTLKFIDKYEIVTTLGRGSMGVVYKAKDPEIGRMVAIKTLKSVFMGDDAAGNEALQRFRQESRSAGKLHHPNIVTIFEAGRTENGSPYIVMEYIEGKSLEALLAEGGALEPLAVLHYLSQIASAIDYAHSQSVIHRDIKPSNIIVDAHHRPYLLDFGVAKLSDTSLTPAGTVVGTPSYMSPEQIRGSQLDGGTDLFSLAVVTFEAFTGSRPFPGNDFTTVVSNIIHKEPMTLSEAGSSLPADLESVLQRGLAKERGDRYPNALEFIDAAAKVFGVVMDGTGLAGGYTPGLKLPDVATREVAARTRASTVVGSFQPSGLGITPGGTGSSPAVSESSISASASASIAAAAAASSPMDDFTSTAIIDSATNVHAQTNYPNGASVESRPQSQPKENTGTVLRAAGTSRMNRPWPWAKPVIGILALVLLGLGGYEYGPKLMDTYELHVPEFLVDQYENVKGMIAGKSGTEDGDEISDSSSSAETVASESSASSESIAVASSSSSAVVEVSSSASSVSSVTSVVPSWVKPTAPAGGFKEANVSVLSDIELGWLLSKDNKDSDSLQVALVEAAKRPNPGFTQLLADALRNPDFKVRVTALKTLSKDGFHSREKPVLAAIEGTLFDTEFIVRGFAVKSLASLEGPAAISLLESAMKTEKNNVVLKVLNDTLSQLRAAAPAVVE